MAKTWLVWKSKSSSIIPRYEIEDSDPDNWKQGEEHDLNIKRLYPASFDGQFILQLECEGGDLDKDEVIDDGSENWEGDFVVTPTAPNVKIEVKSEDTDIEIENEEILEQEDILNWNRTIIYKTSDNQPIELIPPFNMFINYISNIYDKENDYCVMTLNEDLINMEYPIFLNHNTLTEIIYLPSCLESLPKTFCRSCSSLETINLSNLTNLKIIDTAFCDKCISLKNIDLSNLINLEYIGEYFCEECKSLQSINLSNLNNLKEIAFGFCSLSTSLQSVNISNLPKLQKIEEGFCIACTSLQSINLSNLNNLEIIGDWFLNGCKLIESIDLSSLINLKEIIVTEDDEENDPSEFATSSLKELKSLKYFKTFNGNLNYLNNLTIASEEFQNNLPIEEINNDNLKIWVHDDLYSQYVETYPNLKDHFWCIEDEEQHFLPNNEIWYKTSDNQPVELLTTEGFGANFISNEYDEIDNCCKIKFDGDIINIPGSDYNISFMYSSQTLTDIIHLPSTIKTIEHCFLRDCINLQSVNLSELTNITSIGEQFLFGCSNIQFIDLSALSNITIINRNFLRSCLNLQCIDLSPLSNVNSIDTLFLNECLKLQSITFGNMTNLENIGDSFINSCPLLKTFIMKGSELLTLPLTKSYINTIRSLENVFVKDELLEQYKEALPPYIDKLKPLSEYSM